MSKLPFYRNHPRYTYLWRGGFLVYESFDTPFFLWWHIFLSNKVMSQVASTLPPILCIPLFIGVADAVEAT